MEFDFNGQTVRYANGGKAHDGTAHDGTAHDSTAHDGTAHDSAAPAVVMIHGAGMNRTFWQMQTRYLAHHGYRVVAVDLPGHGGSHGPLLETIPEMGEWMAELVRAMGLAPAHLVGHSMGTYIGLETAAQAPDVVGSLVLIGTAAAMPVHPELLDAAMNNVPHASNLMSSWGFGAPARIGGQTTPGRWLVGSSRALLDVSRPRSLGVDMAACNRYTSTLEAAGAVRCPTTFILGSLDKMTPTSRAVDLIKAVGSARTVTLDNIGHMLPIEAPDETREAIVAALAAAVD